MQNENNDNKCLVIELSPYHPNEKVLALKHLS